MTAHTVSAISFQFSVSLVNNTRARLGILSFLSQFGGLVLYVYQFCRVSSFALISPLLNPGSSTTKVMPPILYFSYHNILIQTT